MESTDSNNNEHEFQEEKHTDDNEIVDHSLRCESKRLNIIYFFHGLLKNYAKRSISSMH